MKKIHVLCIVGIVASVFASCKTYDQFTLNRAMRFDPAIERELPAESFKVIGRVSATAEVIGEPQAKAPSYFKGDTRKYGVLDTQDTVLYRPVITANSTLVPSSPYDAAVGNATYDVITQLEEMGADAVLYVRTRTEISSVNKVQTVKVTISGTAVKLKLGQ